MTCSCCCCCAGFALLWLLLLWLTADGWTGLDAEDGCVTLRPICYTVLLISVAIVLIT